MTTSKSLGSVEILLVEDSPTDRLITTDALERAKIINSLNVVENGVEAMAYLRREGKYAGARRPDLILLDLNLPRKSGREVLEEIKSDPLLKLIPVVVLTTSKAEEDVVRAYSCHANSYMTKPVDLARFADIIRAIGNYWFEIVTLPSEAVVQQFSRPAPARLPGVPGATPGKSVRILLVEDNPIDVLLLANALKESTLFKFEVIHAKRLAEARERLRADSFDIVLTDLGLPECQGLETYRQIRACAGDLPVIVLTGLDDEGLGISTMQEGAQEYIVKGQFSGHALARAVRYAIDKKGIENQLLQSQRMDAIGHLAGGVAHDFNNLLTVIQGHVSLLSVTPASAEIEESLQAIKEAAGRATNLTRQLLTFSRQQPMQIRPLDLNGVIGNFVKMLRRLLGEDIRLELQLAAELPPVLADLGMVEQIILNLAVNARDAMPGGGKLTVHTGAVDVDATDAKRNPDAITGKFARLTVSDTGTGIAPEILPKIFDPFFTTKAAGKGTGLGLATVYGVVRQHQGWINVRSQVGSGTSFDIFLPIKEGALPAEASAGDEKPAGGTETVLVIEDEDAVRAVAVAVLKKSGYRVLQARSGPDAMPVWAEYSARIDLLFTDLIMPGGKTGLQLAEELQTAKPALKVVFTSGYCSDFANEDFPLVEGVNFLQKPYDLDQLVRMIRARLDNRA